MSIEYLNLKTGDLQNFAKTIMRKLGKDFLLENANQEEVAAYKGDFVKNFNEGVVALISYLLETSKNQFADNEDSKQGKAN